MFLNIGTYIFIFQKKKIYIYCIKHIYILNNICSLFTKSIKQILNVMLIQKYSKI